MLGKTNMLRFNHPQEAAKLRKKRYVSRFVELAPNEKNIGALVLINQNKRISGDVIVTSVRNVVF